MAMGQINYQVNFKANISSVQTALGQLQSTLNQLVARPISLDNSQIIQATNDARTLQQTLTAATNVNTGKLDMSKFINQLQASGKTIKQYGQSLSQLGPQGQQAFLQLARSISQANIHYQKSIGLANSLWLNLKNVAKWQISSSILMGFTSSIQKAIDYSKDLNKSLTDIRIVSEASAEDMDRFAKAANKSAQALATTTDKYAKAALIYFQQGLNESEVQERTDATMKMVNVTGESAENVSSYMTAIWNNFDDGTKSLEYYADVMTALGASTASSTDEIATGLEKFAGIAETVGLSYEYATSALATLVAQTRQSPETVGTALKTIFSRLQGLKLGETLEDGTDLNKYSEALAVVGVNIKEQNGELKNMDKILDELGQRWNYIGKDQKMALAQTVGGIRQYTQLITLMDNYKDFQVNIKTAADSEGTLQEQQAKYEESWQASSERVQNSMQKLYASIVPEDFLISFNNDLAEVIGNITKFVDSIGGISGVIALLGTIFFTVFQDKIAGGINMALANFKIFSGTAQTEMNRIQAEAYETAQAMTQGMGDNKTTQALRAALESSYQLQQRYNDKVKELSPEQKAIISSAMEIANQYADIAIQAARAADAAEELKQENVENLRIVRETTEANLKSQATRVTSSMGSRLSDLGTNMISSAQSLGVTQGVKEAQEALRLYQEALTSSGVSTQELEQRQEALRNALLNLNSGVDVSSQKFDSAEQILKEMGSSAIIVTNDFDNFKSKILHASSAPEKLTGEMEELIATFKKNGLETNRLESALQKYKNAMALAGNDTKKQGIAFTNFQENLKGIGFGASSVKDAMTRMAMGMKDNHESVKKVSPDIKKLVQYYYEAASAAEGAAKAQENAGKKIAEAGMLIENAGLKYKTLGSATTAAFSAMSSISMAMSSLSSLKNTLNNDDLSTWDKFSQVLMSISMGIPALAMGLSSLGHITKFVTSKTTEGLMAQIGYLMGMSKEQMEVKESIILKTEEKILLNELNKEKLEELGLTAAEIAAYEGLGEAEKKELLIKSGVIIQEEVSTKAIWKNIGARIAHNWHILLVVAALGLLAALILKVAVAESEEAKALRQAQEGLEASTKAYEEATKAADEFKATVEDYQKGVDAIQSLTESTEEYNKAIEESNEKAKELIKTFGLYDQYKVENGVIIIDEETLRNAQNKMDARVKQTENLKNYSEALLNAAQLNTDRTEVKNKFGYMTKTVSGNYYLSDVNRTSNSSTDYSSQLNDEQLNSIIDIFTNIKDDEAAGIIRSDKEILEILNSKLPESLKHFSEEILEQEDSFRALIKSTKETTKAQEFLSKEIMGNFLDEEYSGKLSSLFGENEDKSYLQDSASTAFQTLMYNYEKEREDGINAKISNIDVSGIVKTGHLTDELNKYTKEEKSAILNSLGIDSDDFNVSNDKNLALTYAQLLTGEKDRGSLTVTNKDGKSSVKNAQGQEILPEISNEVIAREIAKMFAIEKIKLDYEKDPEAAVQGDKILQTLDSITDQTIKFDEEFGTNVSTAILDSISNGADTVDVTALMADMAPGTAKMFKDALFNDDGSTKDPSQLLKLLGISEQQLKDLGYKNAKAFQKGWEQGFKNYSSTEYFDTQKQNTSGKDRAEVVQYEKDYNQLMARRQVIKDKLNKAEQERNQAAIDAATAELEAIDEEIKQRGQLYEQYVKEQEIIETMETTLKDLRENEKVKDAYSIVLEDPTAQTERAKEAFAELAGYIGSAFNIDLSTEEFINHWEEIKPLLEAEELTLGEIQAIIYNISAPESIEEFKGQLSEVIDVSQLTETQIEDAYKAINSFDPKVDGFNKLFNSLTKSLGQAGALKWMCENLKDAVPENLQTVYTILYVDKKGSYKDLTAEGKAAYWKFLESQGLTKQDGAYVGWKHDNQENFQKFVDSEGFNMNYFKVMSTDTPEINPEITITVDSVDGKDPKDPKEKQDKESKVDKEYYTSEFKTYAEGIESLMEVMEEASKPLDKLIESFSELTDAEKLANIDTIIEGLTQEAIDYEYIAGEIDKKINEKYSKYAGKTSAELYTEIESKRTNVETQKKAYITSKDNAAKTHGGVYNESTGEYEWINNEEGKKAYDKAIAELEHQYNNEETGTLYLAQQALSEVETGINDYKSLVTARDNAQDKADEARDELRIKEFEKITLPVEIELKEQELEKSEKNIAYEDLSEDDRVIAELTDSISFMADEINVTTNALEELEKIENKTAEEEAKAQEYRARLNELTVEHIKATKSLKTSMLGNAYDALQKRQEVDKAKFERDIAHLTDEEKENKRNQQNLIWLGEEETLLLSQIATLMADGQLSPEEEDMYHELVTRLYENEKEQIEIGVAMVDAAAATTQAVEDNTDELKGALDTLISALENLTKVAEEIAPYLYPYNLDVQVELIKNLREVTDVAKYERLARLYQEGFGTTLNVEGMIINQGTVEESEAQQQQKTAEKNIGQAEAQSEFMSSLSDLLSDIRETLSKNIELDIKKFEQNAVNTKVAVNNGYYQYSLSEMQNAYDTAEEQENRYLTDKDKTYELNKINRLVNKELSLHNQNLSAQQKLLDVQEKINKAKEEGVKVSKYDLEMLNAQFELRKAQIAFEEAQQNKTQARLVRNAQGNWSYVFTADQSKIDDAAQKLEDSQKKMSDISEKNITTQEKALLQEHKRHSDRVKQITEEAGTDQIKFQTLMAEENKKYLNNTNYIYSEMQKSLDALGISYNDTTLGALDDFDSIDEAQKSLEESTKQATQNMADDYKTYQEKISQILKLVGEDVNEQTKWFIMQADASIEGSMANSIGKLTKSISDLVSSMGALSDSFDKFKGIGGGNTDSPVPDPQTTLDQLIANKTDLSTYLADVELTEEDMKRNFMAEIEPLLRDMIAVTTDRNWKNYTPEQQFNFLMSHLGDKNTEGSLFNLLAKRKAKLDKDTVNGYEQIDASELLSFISSKALSGEKWSYADVAKILNEDASIYRKGDQGSGKDNDKDGDKDNDKDGDKDNVPPDKEEPPKKEPTPSTTVQNALAAIETAGNANKEYEEQTGISQPTNPEPVTQPTKPTWEEIVAKNVADYGDSWYNKFYPLISKDNPDDLGNDGQSGREAMFKKLIGQYNASLNNENNKINSDITIDSFRKANLLGIVAGDEDIPNMRLTLTKKLGYDSVNAGRGTLNKNSTHTFNWQKTNGNFLIDTGTGRITLAQLTKAMVDKYFEGFDTGGYTGNWNTKDGKLAVLHEKEIVLNKTDTKNLLSAVEILRGMSSSIAGMLLGNAGHQMNGLARAISVAAVGTQDRNLQQQVHIDASFPGVTSAFEIETALNNIINDVAQYAEIKKF